jgi:two-component system, NarL family, nitrate/nitrite response regulator NarL
MRMAGEEAQPIRVFLIDDHRSILWGLEKLIESARPAMRVVGSAASCAACLDLLEAAAPDVIVLDLDLGAENGLDAIPLILERSPAKILVLTGVRDKSVHDRAVLAGARGVVEKEAPAETILTAIARVHEGQLWLDRAATGRIFVEFSRKGGTQTADLEQRRIASLTLRERQIIAVTVGYAGATAKTIAEQLHISEHTLRNHLTSIYGKLAVANRLELFAYANRHGLDKLPE